MIKQKGLVGTGFQGTNETREDVWWTEDVGHSFSSHAIKHGGGMMIICAFHLSIL